jgi:UDP-glucose 4-epimerase
MAKPQPFRFPKIIPCDQRPLMESPKQRRSITPCSIGACGGGRPRGVPEQPLRTGPGYRRAAGRSLHFAARALAGDRIEIWGDGSAIRDYLYVDDAISGLLATMLASPDRFAALDPVVNIGSGHGVSLRELISLLTHILDRPIEVLYKPAREFDVRASVLDISRARNLLGWTPKIGLEEGLSRHIAYLKQQLVDRLGHFSDREI